jgi:hypothetical protein
LSFRFKDRDCAAPSVTSLNSNACYRFKQWSYKLYSLIQPCAAGLLSLCFLIVSQLQHTASAALVSLSAFSIDGKKRLGRKTMTMNSWIYMASVVVEHPHTHTHTHTHTWKERRNSLARLAGILMLAMARGGCFYFLTQWRGNRGCRVEKHSFQEFQYTSCWICPSSYFHCNIHHKTCFFNGELPPLGPLHKILFIFLPREMEK